MKIEVITTYYREEFLAPLFMRHYEGWADTITVITARFPEDKMDDEIKKNLINAAIDNSDADWVIVVDFDEFVFPLPLGTGPRKALEDEPGHKIRCDMRRMWRHESESDVDRMKPPLFQRLHGMPDHVKPCIFKPRGVTIDIGTHAARFPPHYAWGKPWSAAHWHNADPCFSIQRSYEHRQTRLSFRQQGLVPEWKDRGYIERLYPEHLHDPQVITPVNCPWFGCPL